MPPPNQTAERLTIDSIASRLTDEENAFRMVLMERTIERGGPLDAEAAGREGGLHPNAPALIESLIAKRVVVGDEEGNLNFIYPVSALETSHRVSLEDGRRFSAMCAIDAMGTAFTFQQNVEVESRCSECGERISVRIEQGELAQVMPSSIRVLHVDLNKFDNWAAAA
jgi:hypothetical protein